MSDTLQTRQNRYETQKSVMWMDGFMHYFITLGGATVILVVCALFVFIFWQTLPLFMNAEVAYEKAREHSLGPIALIGSDEYMEMPFMVAENGDFLFVPKDETREAVLMEYPMEEAGSPTAFYLDQASQTVLIGTDQGRIGLFTVSYESDFADGKRIQHPSLDLMTLLDPLPTGGWITRLAYQDAGDRKMIGFISSRPDNSQECHLAIIEQETSLFGSGDLVLADLLNLRDHLQGRPERVLIGGNANAVVVLTDSKVLQYFELRQDQPELVQVFQPFEDLPEATVETMEFLLGDNSLVLVSDRGFNRVFSLNIQANGTERLFNRTKSFTNMPGPSGTFSHSLRNKAFLLTSERTASLRFATTESVRWERQLEFRPVHTLIGSKYNRILMADDFSRLHWFTLNDPHPEGSFKGMFGKIWYEGYSKPSYEWQSTGGSDAFEPKLSMIPLIFGTLKGTLYSLMLAVPIALLAALYTSQFAHATLRRVIKPFMEIMATLPSVVLGFLGALWLAPILERQLPGIILILIVIPSASIFLGWGLASLPTKYRRRLSNGFEFMVFTPILIGLCWLCWNLGSHLESILFTVNDPATGMQVADFRLWWTSKLGSDFQQRNSLVVGIAMGFAVIPIIFTIVEDSLTNVPPGLKSASLALGATRWQTAFKVVVPTALPGIFSALMIGFGRAVGETMIMVMATGNTPILDWNLFNGMRTLAANIAVELPEAPHGGTLYRTLFFGAMTLFLMTFVVNTLAEILRNRLRDKYKTV